MALQTILTVTGSAVYISGDDIDTDRIIPARFLKCITFDGLGQYAFYDERFTSEGIEKKHPLNDSRHKGAKILIAGSNFGCGSSREHAPQALYRYGFHAILAESYAEIFFGNATTLGIPCLTLPRESLSELAEFSLTHPSTPFHIDVASCEIKAGDKTFQGTLPEHAKNALTKGKWDSIAELIENTSAVQQTAQKLPYFH